MDAIVRDLQKWIPRLLSVWRTARKMPEGPEDRLLPREMQEVSAAVRTLSRGLTRDRELAGARYMEDPRLLGGYLLFYWPVSYAQARHALQELPQRPRQVCDLGSGPGPVAFACMDAGAGEITAADRSPAAMELARGLAAEAGEALYTRAWNGQRGDPPPDGPSSSPGKPAYDLVTLSHVVNELWPEAPDAAPRRAGVLEKAFTRVKPGGSVLVVEPALRETSRALLQVRDLMIDKGFAVRSPCLFKGHCPALVKATDWCHAERPWEPPKLVADIARQAGLHKEALKMSYMLFAAPGEGWPATPPGRLFRIVSEPLASKGRQRYIGCGPEGRVGLALQDKHQTPKNAAFSRLFRGDVIAVEGTEERGDGLALDDRSTVSMVAHAGERVKVPEPQG
ncbi:MAG TPA: small ribosomal subunit Rsm22 family protein [Myxococcales bacterium]|jgi:hypothetical protein